LKKHSEDKFQNEDKFYK